MLRIHFTVEDLSRLRMVASLGPVAESVFALELFARDEGAVFSGWRSHVRDRLGSRLPDIERLVHEYRSLPELLTLLGRATDTANGTVRVDDQARQWTTAAVFDFCRTAVVPYWSWLRGSLEGEREARGQTLITNGVEGMLGSLHPAVSWHPPVLELRNEPDRDLYLRGRGLVLSPALFLAGKGCVVIDAEQESGLPTVVFPAAITPTIVSGLWSTLEPGDQAHGALGALVGHTRAAALQALIESCTTGVLSRRVGISLASASRHTAVLREAGLITTARHRNTALHTLTPLGMALLHIGNRSQARGAGTSLPQNT
jgi:DNA-binding transcriptional ArsR family regulator